VCLCDCRYRGRPGVHRCSVCVTAGTGGRPGATGLTGATGMRGAEGRPGPVGRAGFTGATGATGIPGNTGVIGRSGQLGEITIKFCVATFERLFTVQLAVNAHTCLYLSWFNEVIADSVLHFDITQQTCLSQCSL